MRLSGLDVAFLCLEQPTRPMHLGALLIFDSPHAVEPERIAGVLAQRSSAIPALTRTARATWWPPGGAAWVPDPYFSANEHVFTHRLPDPGAWEQLSPVIASIMAAPLPAGRPPWQLHVIGGLGDHRFGVLAKLHHALTDGAGMPLLAGPLMDDLTDLTTAPEPRPASQDDTTEPDAGQTGGISDWPGQLLRQASSLASGLVADVTAHVRRGERIARITTSTLSATRPAVSALPGVSTTGGARRGWAHARLDAQPLHDARTQHGATLNDVVLSVIAGGLRDWLTDSGDDVRQPYRTFIPVDVRARQGKQTALGNHLSGYLCELPINEPDPLARLRAVQAANNRNRSNGHAHGAGAFPLVAQALPGLAHRITTPLLALATPMLFDTMITSVPVPEVPLRLDGATLGEIHPIAPLAPGHALSIAVAAYHNRVHIGLLGDPELGTSVDKLASAITDAADHLHRAGDQAGSSRGASRSS